MTYQRRITVACVLGSLLILATTNPGYAQLQTDQPTESVQKSVPLQEKQNTLQSQTPKTPLLPLETTRTTTEFLSSETQSLSAPEEPSSAILPTENSPAAAIENIEEPYSGIVVQTGESCDTSPTGSICTQSYSDGSLTRIEINEKKTELEVRKLTTLTNYDTHLAVQNLRSIYQGTQYQDPDSGKKEFEFYELTEDSIQETPRKEILIYEYYPESGHLKKITWALYEEKNGKSILTSHAYLAYDKNGQPDEGLAESMERGALTAEILNIKDAPDESAARFMTQNWKSWENWMTSRQLSIYLS